MTFIEFLEADNVAKYLDDLAQSHTADFFKMLENVEPITQQEEE